MSSTQMDVAWAHTTILKDVLEAAARREADWEVERSELLIELRALREVRTTARALLTKVLEADHWLRITEEAETLHGLLGDETAVQG